MSIGKWLGVGAGWFFGGPIGAIIGYHIGKNFFNGKNDNEKAYEVSLLILASLVIKADGKVDHTNAVSATRTGSADTTSTTVNNQ